MRFRAVVELNGKTATGIRVPADVVEGLGSGKRPAVRVTIGGYAYRNTVASYSGSYLLPLSAENRTAAGVNAGDEVDVDVELDTAPREVTLPADLAAALDGEAGLRQAFDAMSFTHRKEHVRAIADAKSAETRKRRIDKALTMVRERRT